MKMHYKYTENRKMSETEKILCSIGITPNFKGYGYILEAVDILHEHPQKSMEGLYIEIQHKYKVKTWQAVRNAIRYCVARLQVKSNGEAFEKIFGIKLQEDTNIKNSVFLQLIAKK